MSCRVRCLLADCGRIDSVVIEAALTYMSSSESKIDTARIKFMNNVYAVSFPFNFMTVDDESPMAVPS